jgi:hypothetical protein
MTDRRPAGYGLFLGSSSRRRHPLLARCHRNLVGSYVLNRLTEWRSFLDYQVGRDTERRPKGSIVVAFYDAPGEDDREDDE